MDDVRRGQRMKELREGAGLLQRQVGAHFDIDKAAVSEWERGLSSPDRRKLVELDSLYCAGGEVLQLYGIELDAITRLGVEISQLRSAQAALSDQVERLALDTEAFRRTVAELLAIDDELADDGDSQSEPRAGQ